MTYRIPVDLVQAIYRDQVSVGHLMDRGKLEAAVAAPFQNVFGVELYATVPHKAVKLLEGISRAQAYADGNKRLAWLTMTTFLQLNGLDVTGISQQEGAAFTLTIQGDEQGLLEAALWLSERLCSFPGS